ncbi:MAG: TIGR00268 family protein, partial [Desulfobacteraceae bacterium]|nr:TIGR00268 family protein [Desulfobacteraceae bacterium]
VDAGFSKKEIRACSKQMGLGIWDLPSQSCLATRIPYYDLITQEKLEMVDQGESFLRELGFNNLRVRCHKNVARIEMDTEGISSLMDKRRAISRGLKKIGFKYVSCDLDGYKTGNMNKF